MAASLVLVAARTVAAGQADVVGVTVVQEANGDYRFDVTVRHGDTGWEHYADRWEVVAPDGTVLAVRTLAHPHVNEQPFMRSLTGVRVPEGIMHATVRAHDRVHGYGGTEMTVELAR